jgi:hypothetical protein
VAIELREMLWERRMVGGGSLEIVRMFEREDVALRANWEDLRFSFQDLESRRVLGPGEEALVSRVSFGERAGMARLLGGVRGKERLARRAVLRPHRRCTS